LLRGLALQYLVDDCELVAAADRRQLQSSDIATFVIPRTYTRLGDFRLRNDLYCVAWGVKLY